MCELTVTIEQLQAAYDKNPLFSAAKPTIKDCIMVQALIEDIDLDGRWKEKANVDGALYFCKVDHISGALMVEGWCLYNGEYYFINEEDAEKVVKTDGYADLEEADDETLGTQWCEWWGGCRFEARVEALEAKHLTNS